MAPIYLVLVFHSVVLLGEYWPTALGLLLALLLLAGSVAAAVSLVRRIGHSCKATGNVEAVHVAADRSALQVEVRLETVWRGHKAGQFAFLDFEDAEGAHPFTISSAWRENGRITFIIKGLGDYNRRLPDLVEVGQRVIIEGPYGRFDFSGDAPQLWIGGGVGITPFIARMEDLATRPASGAIDLFYSTAKVQPELVAHLRELAAEAGVQFHLVQTPPKPPLSLDMIEGIVRDWRKRDIWFCGPSSFAETVRARALERGFEPQRFHQELFEMR